MKYSHRKAQMEANRLKNLANPNFEKKQVKYDREKKKREEKRDLRMQAIINGVELDMSYMRGMSNRQKKKEEVRIREAKKIREERLAAMGLGTKAGSNGSSPASSDDEAGDEAGGVKLNGNTREMKGAGAPADQQDTEPNGAESQFHEQVNPGKKRKSPTNTLPEDEKKGNKKQKKAKAENVKEEPKAISKKDHVGKKSGSGKMAKILDVSPNVSAESSNGEDEAMSVDRGSVEEINEDDDEIVGADKAVCHSVAVPNTSVSSHIDSRPMHLASTIATVAIAVTMRIMSLPQRPIP